MNEALELLERLAENEIVIADLYRTYADKLPEYAAFWQQFVQDEKVHAQWIRSFIKLAEEEKISLDVKRFNREPVIGVNNYVKNLILQAKNKSITEREALSMALDIEQSLLERRFFDILESDTPEMKKLLRNLANATAFHKNKLWLAWDQVKHLDV